MKQFTDVMLMVCLILLALYLITQIVSLWINNWAILSFEIVPETRRVLDGDVCDACKNGWSPVECACTCKFKDVETGRYFLVKKEGAK